MNRQVNVFLGETGQRIGTLFFNARRGQSKMIARRPVIWSICAAAPPL
jgi:hypothetical protein